MPLLGATRLSLLIGRIDGSASFAEIRNLFQVVVMAYIVNGKRIDDETLEEEFESIKEHYQSMGEVVCCDRDEEFWGYARENLINRTLLEQASIERFGEVDDAAVEARLSEVMAEHGSEKEFYDNTGFNKGDEKMILVKLKSSMLVDRFLEAELGEPVKPTDDELEAFYQENIASYMTAEEVRVSQVFFEPSSHEAAREAYMVMRNLRQELLDGKDFDEAAKEHGSDKEREIDLGFMKEGETMPEIEAITFSLNVDEISPVVATHYGFHIFKVTARNMPEPIPTSEVPDLEERLVVERRNKETQDLIESLKATGSVEEIAAEAV